MKRTLLVLVTIVFAAISLFASPRSEQQAIEAASEFLIGHSHVLRAPAKDGRLTHSWTALQTNGQPAFYVFNRGENDGFVIVSAEDRTYTILSYGDTGHFDETKMPENMRSWLEGYARTIEQVAAMPENQAARLYAPRRKPAKTTNLYTPVAPLCSTQWNQGTPYNNLCPVDAGGRCVTGCVATAAAQVMKKYNYPEQGIGSHSYDWEDKDGNVTTLSADFGATTYQWSDMIDNYQATSSTAAQKTAVATLMYHCGVACEMNYTSGSSGANANTMLNAMVTYFGYDAGINTILLDYMGEEAFVQAIAADLALGHPVYFTGRTIKDEGHAFVCDGINADGLVHINWGWGGNGDNYYRVSVLDPENQGTGGSSGDYAFTENVTAFTGIQPDKGGKPMYTITGSELQFENLTFSRNDYMYFQISEFSNRSISPWEGQIGYQLYQNGQLIKTQLVNQILGLNPGWYYDYVYMSDEWSSLQDGEYEFVPVFTTSGQNGYTPVMIRGFGEYRCTVTVSGDNITITLPDAPTPPEPTIDPTAYEFTYLDAIYTPGKATQGYRWDIQLATKNFYEEGATNQLCVLFTFIAAYDDSFLGSYLTSASGINACEGVTVYEGNSKSYTTWSTENGECTLVYDENAKQYTLHYTVVIGKQQYIGEVVLGKDVVGAYRYENNNYSEIILDFTRYSSLTPSQASALAKDQLSAIPYTVAGRISQITNTPEEIQHYGNARFYLADEQGSIFACNVRWLGNVEFTTGEEIEVDGTGIIVGKLDIYDGKSEVDGGYFCQYTAPEKPVDPIDEDEENENFSENFDLYKKDLQYIFYSAVMVEAEKEISAKRTCFIRLQFFVPEGEDDLPVGKYPINLSTNPKTVLAGYNDSYLLGSWAAYIDPEEGNVWYLEYGSVTVKEDGTITVDATNSHGRSVKCQLLKQDTEAVDNVSGEMPQAQKILRNRQLLIIRNGVVYTISGTIVND